jgi:hypothetical protein
LAPSQNIENNPMQSSQVVTAQSRRHCDSVGDCAGMAADLFETSAAHRHSVSKTRVNALTWLARHPGNEVGAHRRRTHSIAKALDTIATGLCGAGAGGVEPGAADRFAKRRLERTAP